MRSKHRKWLYYCLFLIVLLPVGAGAAEYNSGNRTLTGSIGGEYYYKGTIDTTGNCIVNPGISATASAFKSVILRPGFKTQLGGVFVIRMGDKDGDLMADDWEKKYGLDPTRNDANLDADNDGVSNLNEYLNKTVPVIVYVNPPLVNIMADKTFVKPGGDSTVYISWTSANAYACEIDGYGSVSLNGGMTVRPLQTTTYTITAHGSTNDGLVYVKDSVTVEVKTPRTISTKYIYDNFGRINEVHKTAQ